MKLRNQLLALFCLLVFIGGGVLFFRTWVVQRPFAMILFVGDGLVVNNLTAARMFDAGADHRLTIDGFPHLALMTNYANDFAVPDTAAAASAIATGEKVNNGTMSISPKGRALLTILELAKQQGRAIGIVTTGPLTDAGIAPFYAHGDQGLTPDALAVEFAQDKTLDVALGGGAQDFTPESESGRRKDGHDLLLEMKAQGAEIVRSKSELENLSVYAAARRVGVFANGDLTYSNRIEAGSQEPALSDMVRRAIEMLEVHEHGYLLVVDAALIGRAAGQNDGEHVLTETVDLDRAISTALRYAGDKAVILAAGIHATGGMSLNGYPLRQEHGAGLLGVNASGYPAITWTTGPLGPQKPAASGTAGTAASPAPSVSGNEPAAFYAPTAVDNAADVIVVGKGPGTEQLHGIIDNTAIYQILQNGM